MKVLLLLYVIISATRCQQNDTVTAIINGIFDVTNGTSLSNPENNTTEKCTCVHFNYCDTGDDVDPDIIDLRSGKLTCDDTFMVCCPEDKRHDPIVTAAVNKTPSPAKCGVVNPNGVGFRNRGLSENVTQFGEFPWMVAVLREDLLEGEQEKVMMYKCGGSLIHPKVVLTAAHCVIDKEKKYRVRAGEWDTQTRNELFPHHDRDVVTIIKHPDFFRAALFNDIALLILNETMPIGHNIDTICLPPQDEVIELTRCFTSGWGKDVFGREGKYQEILKKLELPIVPREVCLANLRKTRLGPRFKLHKSFLCAGGEGEIDTCTGDGGSPLICPIPGSSESYYQVGIVSWGISCGQQDVPGAYANVAMFTDWINSELLSYGIDNSSYTY